MNTRYTCIYNHIYYIHLKRVSKRPLNTPRYIRDIYALFTPLHDDRYGDAQTWIDRVTPQIKPLAMTQATTLATTHVDATQVDASNGSGGRGGDGSNGTGGGSGGDGKAEGGGGGGGGGNCGDSGEGGEGGDGVGVQIGSMTQGVT